MTALTLGDRRIELVQGDITTQETEAIVNAANERLRGGGGVDGAIHRAGGPAIMAECRRIGGCPTGDAKVTTGGNLRARYVIHTVGPIYRDGRSGEPELLASAYARSIEEAIRLRLASVAFPSISTGVYGYPIASGAPLALDTVAAGLSALGPADAGILTLVRFVLFSAADFAVYQRHMANLQERWR